MKDKIDRRNILKGAAATLIAVTASEKVLMAQTPTPTSTPTPTPTPLPTSTPTPISSPTLTPPSTPIPQESQISEINLGNFLRETNTSFEQINNQSAETIESLELVSPLNTTSGATAFQRDESEWAEISNRVDSLYGITSNNTLSGNLQSTLLPIDYDFKNHYSQVRRAATTKTFSEFHLEFLLDQAADLLDRGIRDRAEWDAYGVEAFNTSLELKEYSEIDKIHKEETAAGFYNVAAEESYSQWIAEQANFAWNKTAADYLNWLIRDKYSNAELNIQSGNSQLAAVLTHQIAYSRSRQQAGDLLDFRWNGQPNKIPEHMKLAAFSQSWHNLLTEKASLEQQYRSLTALAESAKRRIEGLKAKANWDQRDIGFRRARTAVARRLADLKSKSFTEPNGALNYPERMAPLKTRFQRDFGDAVDRVFVAQNGLQNIYGYDTPLPVAIQNLRNSEDVQTRQYFDECLIWVRDAISWMVAFSQLDQNYVLPVSTRNILTENPWKNARRNAEWNFKITETLFPDQFHVRLRGISVFVVIDRDIINITDNDDDDAGVWQAAVRVPTRSFCRHLSGRSKVLDQSKIPVCRMGRVTSRRSRRDPDITGVTTLHNVSPFGDWNVKLSKVSTAGKEIENIKDVLIELHLAVRAKP